MMNGGDRRDESYWQKCLMNYCALRDVRCAADAGGIASSGRSWERERDSKIWRSCEDARANGRRVTFYPYPSYQAWRRGR